MKKILFSSILLVVLAGLASCAEIKPITKSELKETRLGLYTMVKDTTWEGRIRITGDVYVKKGVTLTIKPGTVIRFDTIAPKLESQGGRNMFSIGGPGIPYFPGAEIIIRGRIIAIGTKDRPIIFTSADPSPRPGIWGAVNLLGSNGDVFKYCHISYAYNGIHNHASHAKVTKCIFHDNGTALSFIKANFNNTCVMDIEDNTIVGNLSGISARYANITILHNDISNNKFYGIWLHEGDTGRIAYNDIMRNGKGIFLFRAAPLKVHLNNIAYNKEYNIALAVETPNDVDASNNWWGTTDPAKIKAKFYDKRTDSNLGIVNFRPFLKTKLPDTVK